MKIISYLFLAIFSSVFCFGQTKEKESIMIFSVNFYTRTIISVPCEKFATAFNQQIITNEVFAEDSIRMLNQFIKNIKFSKKEEDFDARAKLIYKNKAGNELIICVNNFNVIVDGRLAKKNKKFFQFILSLIPKEQLMSSTRRSLLQ